MPHDVAPVVHIETLRHEKDSRPLLEVCAKPPSRARDAHSGCTSRNQSGVRSSNFIFGTANCVRCRLEWR